MAVSETSLPKQESGPAWGPDYRWWHYQELFLALVSRDLRSRYKGSILGFAWTLLQPLLLMIVYTILFSRVARLPIPHYHLFLLSGLLPWLWLQGALTYSANSLVQNRSIIRRVAFPTQILPAVAVATQAVQFFYSLPLLLLFLGLSGVSFGIPLLLLPVLCLAQFTLSVGLGLIIAIANVYFRDVEYTLPFVMMIWMYMTPVLYDEKMIPKDYRFITWLNPMSPIISAYRDVLFQARWPVEGLQMSGAVLFSLLMLGLGIVVFKRFKYRIPEVV